METKNKKFNYYLNIKEEIIDSIQIFIFKLKFHFLL
jgi:hypothetical protein